jgi:heme-degrading monooxygenase HmoA
MYARLTISRISPDRIEEFKRRYEEDVLPATKSQKGYKGVYALVDRKTGNGCVITLWASEEDALANERDRFYQEVVAKFITFYKTPPIREGYEVILEDKP